MNYAIGMKQAAHAESKTHKPILPNWIMERSASETRGSNDPENAGFQSGSALALLHVVLHDPTTDVPSELLRNRLALKATINCLKIEGRVQTEADIRDAFYLSAPGDAMGPAGDMLVFWRKGTSISLKHARQRERLVFQMPEGMQEQVAEWLDQADDAKGNPVAAAIAILTCVLKTFPRHEATALLCADIVLARALGLENPLPLFGLYLNRKVLRAVTEGDEIRIACHEAVARASQDAARLAHDLARRAGRLRAIAPKLRSKGSDEAINLFLSEDAVLPSTMLSPTIRGSSTTMTSRSARRFCERLIELGVVRELTGRASFRLYGVGS